MIIVSVPMDARMKSALTEIAVRNNVSLATYIRDCIVDAHPEFIEYNMEGRGTNQVIIDNQPNPTKKKRSKK